MLFSEARPNLFVWSDTLVTLGVYKTQACDCISLSCHSCVIVMSLLCHCHVTPVSLSCDFCVIVMLLLCHYVTPVSLSCDSCVIVMSLLCHCHVIPMHWHTHGGGVNQLDMADICCIICSV